MSDFTHRLPGINVDLVITHETLRGVVSSQVFGEKIAPPPHYCHPYYMEYREIIWEWLDGDLFGGSNSNRALRLPKKHSVGLVGHMHNDVDLLSYLGKAWHLAPFVGDPFFYWWRIAEDKHGRRVAGRQQIRHIDQWEYERLRGREPWNF